MARPTTEAWGFKNGEDCELRATSRSSRVLNLPPGVLEGGWEWHRVKIVSFTANQGIVVKLPTGRSWTVNNPKQLRKWAVPSTPEDIARFLGET